MSQFEAKTIICPHCNKGFAHNALRKHMVECISVGAPCPLDCGHQDLLKGIEELENHLKNVCINMIHVCNRCGCLETLITMHQHKVCKLPQNAGR